ncbi:AcrR family transcriptional regulator [Sphingobium wenxiniae]|jgi:AcrR family transcriptional regulator|uniref:TetR family transcriptional regulator n=2 Tax=Sphingomonadaceae TaxID=41297 RepID=A0A562K1T9_SPHWJ|nr:TetR/AcrR family transcriptional regulator [Sphingobium wenxiniae]MBB6193697.1 AcrR family transcriptional regulator [Sphingobium wenxiniae]MCF8708699.1 TetR/AcrR family transcriptional regulator [Rhizorhapis sp. SPR117]TWH89390.1 TetR family transcriptional regulator [Sphingobium wenxiniae]SCW91609.1 transcriptional regulator, TetR family [Sphingobium faniae]
MLTKCIRDITRVTAMCPAAPRQTLPSVQLSTRKRSQTHERLLDFAYDAIIQKGFAATSIEELVEAAGITKSGFFYHFKDKNDLARQLLERYLAESEIVLDQLEVRARELHDDPLHAFLIFLKLYSEMVRDMIAQHPGCIVSTLTYQDRLFDETVVRLNREGMLAWRARFLRWLEEIVPVHPPRVAVDISDLADQMTVIADGSIIMQRALADPSILERQAMLHRSMVRRLFLDN